MFAQHGANIVLADIQEAAGKALEQELTAQGAKYVYLASASIATATDRASTA